MSTNRRLFGTDGIRGTANTDPMTAGTALRLGQAAGLMFTRGNHRHRVVIGKDARLSGYMLEPALTAGFTRRRHGRHPPRPAAHAGGRAC
jgi:phosphoglucosamine mutase